MRLPDLRLPDPDAADALLGFLRETGFTAEGLKQKYGAWSPASPQLGNRPRLLERTREMEPLDVLSRWFLIGVAVDEPTARRALPRSAVESLLATGLLAIEGDGLEPTVLLGVHGDRIFAFDRFETMFSEVGDDYILGISPSARHLIRAMIPRPAGNALDLGTGCGILGVFAADHARHVLATDLNPRAAVFAAFNARLNGVRALETGVGDLFEPVAGRRFDYIICNPPFVIRPFSRYKAVDNRMDLDFFSRGVVRGGAERLEEGGFMQLVCEWVEVEGESWSDRLTEWFSGTGCDVWVLTNFTHEPSWYAQTRLQERAEVRGEAADAMYLEWMEYYRRHRIRTIQGGLITLRRRTGRNWLKIEDIAPNLEEPFGEAILAGFAARDFLDRHEEDEAFLAARLRLVPGTSLRQTLLWTDGDWSPESLAIMVREGLRQQADLDEEALAFLSGFTGERPTGELVEALVARVGQSAEQVREVAIRTARRLVEQGFLEPAENAGSGPDATRSDS